MTTDRPVPKPAVLRAMRAPARWSEAALAGVCANVSNEPPPPIPMIAGPTTTETFASAIASATS